MSSEDVELVRDAWAAWQRDGPQSLLEFCDREIEWTTAEDEPESGTFHGGDAVMEVDETHVVRLRGGKIAEIREYRTMEQARKARKASLESF